MSDLSFPLLRTKLLQPQPASTLVPRERLLTKLLAVSYTHLTLPTSDLV